MDTTGTSGPPPIFSLTSLLSLLAVVVILAVAYTISVNALPRTTTGKVRFLFIWHLFDALVHLTLEASYLYNCFFSFAALPKSSDQISTHFVSVPMTPPGVSFLGQPDRLYGAFYGTSPTAKLWQEYAKADKRWGGSDLTVISLELLTVFVMAPLAIYVCHLLRQQDSSRAWFWMVVIATGELYGGTGFPVAMTCFMTFSPEWLAQSPNLDTSNFMYLWLYLFFFNTLWVWIPLWILWEANSVIGQALSYSTVAGSSRKESKSQ